MLRIITGNRQEALLAELAATLGAAAAGGDPLVPDRLVAERGTDRWLYRFLAETHGIAANLAFEPPAGFLWGMLRRYVPDAPADPRFDRAPLAWRLMRLLPPLLAQRDFAPLAHYLRDDDGRKLHGLCDRIAGTFNDYLVYRAAMILAWERGERTTRDDDERWQQTLWRAVIAETGPLHRAGLLHRFLREEHAPPPGLPARVSVFGIPALPPVYVEALVKLARHVDIDLYVLNPAREFWGDLASPKHLLYLPDGSLDGTGIPNRLLASWGQPVRHFIAGLYGHEADYQDRHSPDFVPRTRLEHLQEDIHRVRETPFAARAGDDSLRIVSAWSPLREMEILHDTLLDRFQRDATLKPRDVLVAIPDIERYAPAIAAVFGAAEGKRHIPWTITDVPRRQAHPVMAAIESLLRLPESRLAASEVLGLLETPAVARRFGFARADLAAVRNALHRARLHGDLDGEARARRGLPADDMHSWRFALRRLFLGVAMTTQPAPVLGVLPEPAFEGQGAVLLGNLQRFVERLAHWQQALARPQRPAQWNAALHQLLDDFLDPDEQEQDAVDDALQAAREFLDEVQAANCAEEIPSTLLRDDFRRRLAAVPARGNLRGAGVTFCGLVPMRSMPYRMIALAGMGCDAFPRQQTAPGFDLVARHPQAGDRARRHDDRHLFLELLLSARDAFHVSYTGRNPRDDSALEPSVPVRELIDAVVAMHGGEHDERKREAILRQLVAEHPLQPFSRRYFAPADGDGSPPLFTCDDAWLPPARTASGAETPRFCTAPLPPPEPPVEDIALDRLLRFFRQPQAGFLRERFGVVLREEDDAVADDEPFTVEGLAAWQLKTELLQGQLAGEDAGQQRARLQARGDLPQAGFATPAWQRLETPVAALAEALRPRLAGRRTREIDLVLPTANGTRRLHGRLDDVTPGGRVEFNVSSFRSRQLLPLWIRHLAWLASEPQAPVPHSTLVTRDGDGVEMHVLVAVDDPHAELAHLIALFEEGLRRPLPLLPACSHAWAQAVLAGKAHDAPGKALAAWQGSRFGNTPAERDEPAVRIVFGDREPPFDDAFVALARAVYGPVLAALRAGGGA